MKTKDKPDLKKLREDALMAAEWLTSRHDDLTRNETDILHECWCLVGALDNVLHVSTQDKELNEIRDVLQDLSDCWPAIDEPEQHEQLDKIAKAYRMVGNLTPRTSK